MRAIAGIFSLLASFLVVAIAAANPSTLGITEKRFMVGTSANTQAISPYTMVPILQLSSAVSRKTHDARNFVYVGSGAPPPGRKANYGLDVYSGHDGSHWDPISLSVYAPPTDEDLRDPALLPSSDMRRYKTKLCFNFIKRQTLTH